MPRKISLLACTAFLAFATVVNAATIHVPSQKATIQDAINVALNWDTILVAPGGYLGSMSVSSKPICLISEAGPDSTTITSTGDLLNLSSVMLDTFRISGFSLKSTGGRGIAANNSVFSVTNCRFLYTLGSYIHFSHGFGNIHDNIFLEQGPAPSSSYGILIDNYGEVSLTRNVFYGVLHPTTFWTTASQVQIINNTFVSCTGGVNVAGVEAVPGAVYNNIFLNIPGTALSSNSSGPAVDYNLYYHNGLNTSGVSPGSHSLFVDPYLTDVDALDFSPLPGSPCVDAGNPDPAYNDPDDTRNDIGAIRPQAKNYPLATHINLGSEKWWRVGNPTPAFYWTYYDTGSAPQTGYWIQVGVDNDWSVVEMWDSGEIASSAPFGTYAGLPLLEGTDYFYRVRVRDASGWGNWTTARFHTNNTPTAPIPYSPLDGATIPFNSAIVPTSFVSLGVFNSTDADGDTLTYRFEVYADSTLANYVAFKSGVLETPLVTKSGPIVELSSGTKYWWRARVWDGASWSNWSDTRTFITRGAPGRVRIPSQFPAINDGLEVALPYDTVLIAPGTWSQNIRITKNPLTLLSEEGPDATVLTAAGGDVIILSSMNTDTVRIIGFGFDAPSRAVASYYSVFSIENCKFHHASWISVHISGGFASIRNCLFTETSTTNVQSTGVRIDNYGQIHFERNVFYGLRSAAAIEYTAGPVWLVNNTFVNCQSGLYLSNAASSEGIVYNNIFSNIAGTGVIGANPGPTMDYDLYYQNGANTSGIATGTHSLFSDPKLGDPMSLDFNLQFESPCIDAGNPDAIYNDPDGTRNDIGAMSFNPALQVKKIRVGAPEDSLHLLNHYPMIVWSYFDPLSKPHTRSQVEVGTDADWSVAEMWNPPEIVGPDTAIQYAGAPLVDGSTYYARLRVMNDSIWSSWRSARFRMNTAPSVPVLAAPSSRAVTQLSRPSLVLKNSVDSEGDSKRYDFELYADSLLTNLIDSATGRPEGVGESSWRTDSLTREDQRYWWRARAFDGFEYSAWSAVLSFWLDVYNTTPAPSVLSTPSNYSEVTVPTPHFSWNRPLDPDPIDTAFSYTLVLAADRNFIFKTEINGLTAPHYNWADSLPSGIRLYWRVVASDVRGGQSTSLPYSFITNYNYSCSCPCFADPHCDGVRSDVLDIVAIIDIVFNGASIPQSPGCPKEDTDVNCDGMSDVFDVLAMLGVAFQGANPEIAYCNPCALARTSSPQGRLPGWMKNASNGH